MSVRCLPALLHGEAVDAHSVEKKALQQPVSVTLDKTLETICMETIHLMGNVPVKTLLLMKSF